MRLRDRVALVTGAAAGLGAATALRFASEGAHVILVDRDAPGLEKTHAAAADLPGSTETQVVDLVDLAALEALFERVDRDHGQLNVLHNNAGLIGPGGLDVPPDEWDALVNVNLRAGFYATRFALPLLRRATPHASVIFTASISGIVGSPENSAYSATKGAVVMLVKSLAVTYGHEGIRFNALCPGPSETEMLASIARRRGEQEADWWAGTRATIPLGRLGRPDEIANAALFLASDESSFVHGHALIVDGGVTAA